MLSTLRRIYLYGMTTIALLFTTGVLENLVYNLLRLNGLLDYLGESAGDPNSVSQAFTLLIVDLVVVVPVGGLHWFFIRRDAGADPQARNGIVRATFLTLLSVVYGLVVTFALITTASNLGSPGQESVIAGSLAAAIAWGFGLALLAREWWATPELTNDGRVIASIFGAIAQWIVLITGVVLAIEFIQSVLQATILPLAQCNPNFNYDGGNSCTSTPTVTSAIYMSLVAIVGYAAFFRWARTARSAMLLTLDTSISALIGLITTIIGLGIGSNLLLSLAFNQPGYSWPYSLLSSPNGATTYPNNFISSEPFLGVLIPGLAVMAVFLARGFIAKSDNPKLVRQVAIVTLALPLAFIFFIGVSALLGNALIVLRGASADTSVWINDISLIISGVAWLGFWPALARMSNISGDGPTVPRRIYVLITLGGTLSAAIISLAVALFAVLTSALGQPIDASGNTASQAFGVAIATGAGAGYYLFVLLRDLRHSRAQAAAAPPAEPPAPTLESVLQQVAQGQVAVPQAVEFLRQHPEIR